MSTTSTTKRALRKKAKPVVKRMERVMIECPPEFVREIQKRGEERGAGSEKTNTQMAAVALWRLAQGIPTSQIAIETGLERNTIRQLSIRNYETLEEKKAQFAAMYARAASEYTELLFERADQLHDNPDQLAAISPDRLALTIGIMTDHSAKLSGMASTIIEHRSGASVDDAAKMIAEARARIAEKTRNHAIEAEVVE